MLDASVRPAAEVLPGVILDQDGPVILNYKGYSHGFDTHLLYVSTPEGKLRPNPWQYTGKGTVKIATPEVAAKAIETYRRAISKSSCWDSFLFPVGKISVNLGVDPEIFAVDPNGQVMPAWWWLPDKSQGLGVYWDGVQAEFNTNPRTCLVELTTGIYEKLRVLKARLNDYNKEAHLVINNVLPVSRMILQNAETRHIEFGCKPSINVYGDIGEPTPSGRELDIRFAGGHWHAGPPSALKVKGFHEVVTPAIDAILGVAAVAMSEGMEDPRRRIYYGRPGEVRLPDHGLEYRVLSNYWLCHPAITHITGEFFRAAVRYGFSGLHPIIFQSPQEQVRKVIVESDAKGARQIITDNKRLFEALIRSMNIHAEYSKSPDIAMKLLEKGIGAIVAEPFNVEKNWGLDGSQFVHRTWGNACIQHAQNVKV